jgi:hypothetical protein
MSDIDAAIERYGRACADVERAGHYFHQGEREAARDALRALLTPTITVTQEMVEAANTIESWLVSGLLESVRDNQLQEDLRWVKSILTVNRVAPTTEQIMAAVMSFRDSSQMVGRAIGQDHAVEIVDALDNQALAHAALLTLLGIPETMR